MRYRLLFIILINIIFCQALFNRFSGDDSFNGSVKSTSMGDNHLLSSDLNSLVRYNPSRLSVISSGVSIATQCNIINLFERRTMTLKDSFGDFLTEGDYVWNNNYYTNYNGTIAYSLDLGDQSIGIGLSRYQLTNFNYYYEEEVRGQYSPSDGEAAMKDPYVGYHILSSTGDMYVTSYGVGWSVSYSDFSVGVGYNMNSINDFDIVEFIHIDTSYADVSNLSNIPSYNSNKNISIENRIFTGTTIEFNYKKHIFCAVGIESKKYITTTPYNYEIDLMSGLYTFLNTNTDSIYYNVYGLNYIKPGRLSIEVALISSDINPIQVVLGYDKLDYDNSDVSKWKFGFEYLTQNKVPIRGGISYCYSEILSLDPKTRFSIGSGFNYKSLEISYTSTYSLYDYNYPDLFPVEDDVRLYYDKVYESRLEFLISLIYNF